MFETAELGREISRTEYRARVPKLRTALLEVQQELRKSDFPVIVVFSGVDGAGKSETVNLLNEWMDPRWLVTRTYTEPSQEERERPEYWRYWRDLPPKGRIGFFLNSWYSPPLLQHVHNRTGWAELDRRLDRIVAFEKALTDDGALFLKFWMHLGKAAQKKRLKSLEKDPLLSWRVKEKDWENWHKYDKFVGASERIIMRTSTGNAPWHIVEGFDARYRGITVGSILLEAVGKALADRQAKPPPQDRRNEPRPAASAAADSAASAGEAATLPTILSTLDMSQGIDGQAYKTQLKKYQGRLNLLQRQANQKGITTLLVFEGWDAAGKGGAIRRCTAALDARYYQVIPFAGPSDEERQHHYLWRFWRRIGRSGRVLFFDRSWYGRVLVERVEGYATRDEWMRAYAEINDFEEQLVQFGIVLVKYWMHITKDKQYHRFKTREQIPYKRWKITEEDWRNRERWEDYEVAVNDMIGRTSTRIAPWTLVEANDKRFARIKVLKTLCGRLQKALSV